MSISVNGKNRLRINFMLAIDLFESEEAIVSSLLRVDAYRADSLDESLIILYKFYADFYRAEALRERAEFYAANPGYFDGIAMLQLQGIEETEKLLSGKK